MDGSSHPGTSGANTTPVRSRRVALAGLAAAAATLMWRTPAGATEPLRASLTAKRVAGGNVRTTVQAKVAMTGLNWSGTLGTWELSERGSRALSVQPPGVPAKFDLVLTVVQQRVEMQMTMMRGTAYGGPWGPGYGYRASAPIA